METALRHEMSLSHGESIDQYMNTTQVEQKMQQIDAQKNLEIAALNKSDPEYAAKVKQITARAKQTKYKAMKNLNTQNEKVPDRVKANMRRRGSVQQPAAQ